MFFDQYLESVRLLNEMRDEGFNMTFVATRLRGVRDEIRADRTRLRGVRNEILADQLRAIDLTQNNDTPLFGEFPLLTMMDLVEEQQVRIVNPDRTAEQPQVRRELTIKYKVLAKKNLEKLCDNDCAICQDKHMMKDTIITDCCNNYYCSPCLTQWTQSHNTCPTCRHQNPTTKGFRQRSPPVLHQYFERILN
jgi:hypothetical protein